MRAVDRKARGCLRQAIFKQILLVMASCHAVAEIERSPERQACFGGLAAHYPAVSRRPRNPSGKPVSKSHAPPALHATCVGATGNLTPPNYSCRVTAITKDEDVP